METSLFLLTLLLPIVITISILAYIRPILRQVLIDLCGTATRAEFWMRCATMLAVLAALILTLIFISDGEQMTLMHRLSRILLWSLVGAFIGIVVIARSIGKSMMAFIKLHASVDANGSQIAQANGSIENKTPPTPPASVL